VRVVLIAAAGTIFVGAVAAGFVGGVLAADRTGVAWWPILGLLIGVLAGVAAVVNLLRAVVR
jgi:hypothetical protein